MVCRQEPTVVLDPGVWLEAVEAALRVVVLELELVEVAWMVP